MPALLRRPGGGAIGLESGLSMHEFVAASVKGELLRSQPQG
jgi:hypothetical protein